MGLGEASFGGVELSILQCWYSWIEQRVCVHTMFHLSSILFTFNRTQLDINNKRPDRALFLPMEAHRQWAFVPGSSNDCRHQSELLFEDEHDESHAVTNGQADLARSSEGTHHGDTVVAATGDVNEDAGGKHCRDDNVEGRGAKEAGRKGRRERSRPRPRQEQSQQQQREHAKNGDSENEEGPHSPDSLR